MLMEILSRLPVRCLVRFSCASKTWYDLIKSPNFVDMHLNLQLTNGDSHIQTIRCKRYDSLKTPAHYVTTGFDNLESLRRLRPPDVELSYYHDDHRDYRGLSADVKFATHLNGIVCIFSTGNHAKITLWNPALREFKILPDRNFQFHIDRKEGDYALGIGFGFDYTTNDYKVICVERIIRRVVPPTPAIEVVQVYNLKTDSWRILTTMTELPSIGVVEFNSSIFFKGSVYWLVWGLPQQQPPFILTFNMTTELFGEVQCPQTGEEQYCYRPPPHLLLLDKSTISLCYFSPKFHPEQLDVWVMNDNNSSVKSSWVKRYSLTFGSDISRPLYFWKNDKLLLVTDWGGLICFDLSTGQRHRIRRYGNCEYCSLDVVVYVESLVSIR